VARITGVITSLRKRSRYVDSYSKMSGNDRMNKYIFTLGQKSVCWSYNY